MPAVSRKQQRLMASAAQGATFPTARRLRRQMSQAQLRDFSRLRGTGGRQRGRLGDLLKPGVA